MDRNWISIRIRKWKEYVNGGEKLKFAIEHAPSNSNGLIPCPCKNCVNSKNLFVVDVRAHSFFNRKSRIVMRNIFSERFHPLIKIFEI